MIDFAKLAQRATWIPVVWATDDGDDFINLYDFGDGPNGDGPNSRMRARIEAPGTLVRFKSGEVKLVGHVNKNGGCCDCCGDDWRDVVEFADLAPLLEDR